MHCTFVSSGSVAMWTTARATWSTSIVGSVRVSPSACSTPVVRVGSVSSVDALPMSICPHAMSYGRPSSDVCLVSPVTPCFAAVYGAESR